MNVSILGNGAWGVALAEVARRRGHSVRIWGRHPKQNEEANLKEAVSGSEIIILAIPSHAMREVCEALRTILSPTQALVSVAKGIEQGTHLRMTQIIAEVANSSRVAVMSGPTFSAEVQKAIPTAIVAASTDHEVALNLQNAFNSEEFRVYTSSDVVGVELGGALKNVMAIAAGACVGMGLGDNTLAALITRGVAELSRIGVALGGEAQTFFGLSGMGDLILTCSSHQSRNRQVGEGLGRGEPLAQVLSGLKGTAEGVKTAQSVHEILNEARLEAPILREVYSVLYDSKPASNAVKDLMNREPKAEFHKKM